MPAVVFEVPRAAGVQVTSGVIEDGCTDLNLIFNHWIVGRTPSIAAKAAVTLDGKITTRANDSQWGKGIRAGGRASLAAACFPPSPSGRGPVISDDPSLTSLRWETVWCPPFVFDGLLRTVVDKKLLKIYSDEYKDRTIS